MDRDRAATKVVVAVKEAKRGTRVLRDIHLGIRVLVRINPDRGRLRAVARRAIAMMTETRLWREPGTR